MQVEQVSAPPKPDSKRLARAKQIYAELLDVRYKISRLNATGGRSTPNHGYKTLKRSRKTATSKYHTVSRAHGKRVDIPGRERPVDLMRRTQLGALIVKQKNLETALNDASKKLKRNNKDITKD